QAPRVAPPPRDSAADSMVAATPPRTDSTAKARAQQPTRASTASRPGTAAVTTSTVTFLSGAEIYVGAGRQEGLIEGAELVVVRRDSVVSTLRVKFVSSHQSSCEVIRGANDI